jgi:hypothetical protein
MMENLDSNLICFVYRSKCYTDIFKIMNSWLHIITNKPDGKLRPDVPLVVASLPLFQTSPQSPDLEKRHHWNVLKHITKKHLGISYSSPHVWKISTGMLFIFLQLTIQNSNATTIYNFNQCCGSRPFCCWCGSGSGIDLRKKSDPIMLYIKFCNKIFLLKNGQ